MPRGRPVKFKTAADMQGKIEDYFNSLMRPVLIWDKDIKSNILLKNPETDEPYMEQYKPATITGLALALDMTRTGLLDYMAKNKEFAHTITRAKARVEEYAESRLFDRDGARGAEFSLRCNFKWRDKEIEADMSTVELVTSVLSEVRRQANAIDKQTSGVHTESDMPLES